MIPVLSTLSLLKVTTVLGDRLDGTSLNTPPIIKDGQPVRCVKTQSGRELSANLILLCTGQTPNTTMLQEFLPDCIVPEGASRGMARVKRTMQIAIPRAPSEDGCERQARAQVEDEDDAHLTVPYPHLFAIGDAADAFGAINAGHTAYYQAQVAARNILALIKHSSTSATSGHESGNHLSDLKLERYQPGPPAIKISLGLVNCLAASYVLIDTDCDVI